jgi:hypothetical protein
MKETITIPKKRIFEAIWALMLSLLIMFVVAHFGTITYVSDLTPSAKQARDSYYYEYHQKEMQKPLSSYPHTANSDGKARPFPQDSDGKARPFPQTIDPNLARAAASPIYSFDSFEYGIVKGTWELNGFTTISIDYEHEKAKPRWGINNYEVSYLRRTKFYFLSVVYDWQYTFLSTIVIILLLWGLRNFKRNYKIVIR